MSTGSAHEAGWATHAQSRTWRDPLDPDKEKLAVRTLRLLGKPESIRLLDFGCGTGAMTRFFAERGYRVEGLDISPSIIEQNREQSPGIKFHLVEPERPTQLPAGAFDAVFCSEVIEHVYDVTTVFEEFSRILRPGGLLIITTPYHARIKNVVTALVAFEKHFDPTWQHIRFWTKRSLTAVATRHGLIPIRWHGIGRFWPLHKSFFVVLRKAT